MLNEYQVRHVLYLVLLSLVCDSFARKQFAVHYVSTFLMYCHLAFSFMILILLRLWKEFNLSVGYEEQKR